MDLDLDLDNKQACQLIESTVNCQLIEFSSTNLTNLQSQGNLLKKLLLIKIDNSFSFNLLVCKITKPAFPSLNSHVRVSVKRLV